MGRRGPLRQRLLSRLIIDPETGCLLWTGTLNNGGYGEIKANGRTSKVHRVMWQMLEGPIPDGMELDHLCRVRSCASIAHLEVVTRQVNTLRGESPAAAHARQTHCDSGHEFDLVNTYWAPNGQRFCRTCTRAAGKRYRDRLKAEAASHG